MMLLNIVQPKSTALFIAFIVFSGCSQQVARPFVASTSSLAPQKSPLVAMINKEVVRQEDLWPALIELGGQEILDDYLLTIALRMKLHEQELSVLPMEIVKEERLLSLLIPSNEEDSITAFFRDNGIGESRKSQLLWRNAALRKLVQHQVVIQDDAIQRMFEIVHGPKFPIRIIVVSTRADATKAIASIQNGATFSDIAIQLSIDSSSINGGRVSPISCSDSSWPAPIRESISTLVIDEISPPIFIGDRWAVIKITGEPILSSMQITAIENEMRELATRAQERFLMENLAQNLIEKSSVKIFDRNLKQVSGPNAYRSK